VDAKILDVHGPPQPRIEQQIPSRVVIVVVHVHTIALPFPIAAAVQVVIGHYPVRIVVEDYVPGPVVNPAGNEYFFHVHVVAVWIGMTGPDAVVVVVPSLVVVPVPVLVPALVLSVVMPVAVIVTCLYSPLCLPSSCRSP
jgi:hypothetical protein